MKRLIFLFAIIPNIFFGQHAIKGTFMPAEDFKALLLYKIEPSKLNYIDNARLKNDGSFELKLDASLAPGMYRLIYALPEEDNNFDIIYNGEEDIELTFDIENGVVYQSSRENKLLASYIHSMSLVQQSLNNYFSKGSQDKDALAAIFKTQKETQENFEAAAMGTLALNFIKANRFYIPDTVEDVKTYMNNIETHFFDHVDFTNEVLQTSNFFNERMFNYVLNMKHEGLDQEANYKRNTDDFYKAMAKAPIKVKEGLLLDLWQYMADEGFEEVANFIAENYLIAIAKAQNNEELVTKLTVFKNISLGHKAPDFSFEVEENGQKVTKKLSDLQISNSYIVVFWSSTCSHCLEQIPQLASFVKTQQEGKIKVVAIGLENIEGPWKRAIKDLPDFIHVFGEDKWDNPIGDTYGVTATPTYFILNRDKEIIARPEEIEDVKAFFESH
ncbi:TlpA family protein disulfide reductase [Flavobacteriaceae bacterium XHP0103]|uniref:TlpA family protein disulfide reductase n=1 Tax=Marixanthotalea marina TaxID=2844359 RepID=UPI002989BA9D|nr:TlpA disulfide reductase family protein [Marixanthotalea marina]MBU3820761.1 TlpA family protein disulfide reductase [Marixanthotalea marina]